MRCRRSDGDDVMVEGEGAAHVTLRGGGRKQGLQLSNRKLVVGAGRVVGDFGGNLWLVTTLTENSAETKTKNQQRKV